MIGTARERGVLIARAEVVIVYHVVPSFEPSIEAVPAWSPKKNALKNDQIVAVPAAWPTSLEVPVNVAELVKGVVVSFQKRDPEIG